MQSYLALRDELNQSVCVALYDPDEDDDRDDEPRMVAGQRFQLKDIYAHGGDVVHLCSAAGEQWSSMYVLLSRIACFGDNTYYMLVAGSDHLHCD